MAWLERHPTSGRFKICFRWGGRQFKKTVKTTSRGDVEAIRLRLEEKIDLAQRGRLPVPPLADITTFLLSDGKLTQPPKAEPSAKPLTLGELRELYVAAHAHGAMESNSLQTVKMHLRHFATTLGVRFPVAQPIPDAGADRRTARIHQGEGMRALPLFHVRLRRPHRRPPLRDAARPHR